MKKRKNYGRLAYASDDWSFEYSYNDVKVKELVKWMKSQGEVRRCDIWNKAKTMDIKERTLADILKKLVLSQKIQRLSHGIYACLNYKPTAITINTMKVKIMQRSVYHKYAEIEVEVPNEIEGYIMQEKDIWGYLSENEDLFIDEIDKKLSKAEYEFGFGLDNDGGLNEKDNESEWRFDIVGKQYGGHL